ncbi:MAG: hypothetical protein D6822_08445 [Cyanobacteria bacterium J149]|nr:MAG: hypothetical protein D6822_08445 [Cyanobacteria bacterium J149]
MTITTPSGYIVEFKGEEDLTYRDRREIQKAIIGKTKINTEDARHGNIELMGEMIFEAQERTLKIILKSITKPDGQKVSGDLFEEIMNWKNPADGDMVFEEVTKIMTNENTKKKTTK